MIILITTLSILLCITIFFCLKFALTIIKFQENLGKSLDLINSKHNLISEILEIPVFYDSYEVKKVILHIEEVRSSLEYISDILTDNIEKEDLEEVNEKEEE